MAKVNCPNCGAIGEVGSVCEFCGSTIEKKTAKRIQKKEGSQKDSNKKELKKFYSPINITEKEAEKIVKDLIKNEIKKDCDPLGELFEERILFPLNKTIEVLEMEVYPSVWLPFFLYSGETFDGKNIEDYNILAFAGNKKQLPFNFTNPISFIKYNPSDLISLEKNKKEIEANKITKSYTSIWDQFLVKREEWGEEYKRLSLPEDIIVVYLNIIPIKIKPLTKDLDDDLFVLVNANNGNTFLNKNSVFGFIDYTIGYILRFLFYDIYKIKNISSVDTEIFWNTDDLCEWEILEDFELWALGNKLENKVYKSYEDLNEYIRNYDDFLTVKEALIQIQNNKEAIQKQYEERIKTKKGKKEKEINKQKNDKIKLIAEVIFYIILGLLPIFLILLFTIWS